MKYRTILLLATLASFSCKEDVSDSAEARIDKPFHRDVEIYLLEEPLVGAMTGVYWEGEPPVGGFSTGDLDEATNTTVNEYAMKTVYKGSDNSTKIDFHSVTISPPESDPITIEVAFDGSPIEIWSDDRYTAGLRSKETKKANKSEQATPRKPYD